MVIADKMFDFTPVLPFKMELLESAADTNGRYVKMLIWQQAGKSGTPLHIHKNQEKTYTVIRDIMEVYYKHQWHFLDTGKTFTVEKGEPHTFRTVKDVDVIFENIHTPALQFEKYISRLHALVSEGKIKNPMNFSSFIYLSMLWIKHREDLISVKPPYYVMKALAVLGKIFGYRIE